MNEYERVIDMIQDTPWPAAPAGPEDRALTRAMSASAAPILSGAAAAAAGVVGSATAAGLSLLSRAYRGHGDGELSGSPTAHTPVLAPHAEESDVRTQAHRPCGGAVMHQQVESPPVHAQRHTVHAPD